MSKIKLVESLDKNLPMKPLYESISGSPLKEKRLKLHGTAIVCDEPGINGRTYPTRLMTRESKKFTDNYIKYANSLGELNHPPVDDEGNARLLPVTEINLEKVSHIIEELHMVNNHMKIKFRIIEKHPCGAILKALIEDGIPVGVSLRGLGSVYRDGNRNMVADDYELITVDVVGRPSYGKAAMMQSVMEATSSHKIPVLTEAVDVAVQEFRNEIDTAVRQGTLMETQYYSLTKLLNNIGK
jgi:hypothetical protein